MGSRSISESLLDGFFILEQKSLHIYTAYFKEMK